MFAFIYVLESQAAAFYFLVFPSSSRRCLMRFARTRGGVSYSDLFNAYRTSLKLCLVVRRCLTVVAHDLEPANHLADSEEAQALGEDNTTGDEL